MLGEGDRIQKVPEFRAGDSGDSEFSAPGWLVDSLFFPTCQLRVSRFYQSCLVLLPFLLPSSFLPRIATASSRSQWALPDLNRELQISVGTAGPRPPAPDLSEHCRTSTAISVGTAGPQPRAPNLCRAQTASARSRWALPDLNQERQISVGTARPQHTATKSARSQRALPDLNRKRQISVGTARPQPRSQWALPDLNRELQISAGPKPRAPDLGGHCRTSTKSARSQWVLPDLNILQPRAPDLSGHCRTSTASARSQWALPGLNQERQISVGTRSQWDLPDLNREFWNSRLGFGGLAVPTEIWRLRLRSVRQCPWRRECQNRRQT